MVCLLLPADMARKALEEPSSPGSGGSSVSGGFRNGSEAPMLTFFSEQGPLKWRGGYLLVKKYFLSPGEESGLWEFSVGCRYQSLHELSALEAEGPPIGTIKVLWVLTQAKGLLYGSLGEGSGTSLS